VKGRVGEKELFIQKIDRCISKTMKNHIEEPIVIELKDGKTYAGTLDDYLPTAAVLADCFYFDKNCKKWVSPQRVKHVLKRGSRVYFERSFVKSIWIKKNHIDEIFLEDFLQCYIDPYYIPLFATPCNWDGNRCIHADNCDTQLHEALNRLWSFVAISSSSLSKSDFVSLQEAFGEVRKRLILNGAKIP
jgi:small nuclear ribonucleoprotein (snRNP)-like protein